MKITYKEALTILAHLKEPYQKWLKGKDKKEVNNWVEFVKLSVKSNNENNGTEEDLIFIAEDAIRTLWGTN